MREKTKSDVALHSGTCSCSTADVKIPSKDAKAFEFTDKLFF